ncbi:hypothetical protein SAMN02745866_01233 [Alteromonadaceae bacterium Bs31]|nr:hypothetical protein SAMN02745866_01233 [Alteromonadaceae bacterium Bs31]
MLIPAPYYTSIGLLLLAAALSALAGLLPYELLSLLVIFACALHIFVKAGNKPVWQRAFFWLCAVVLGLAIGLFRPEGFNYPLLFSAKALPFDLYLNLGKAFAGYLALVLLAAQLHSLKKRSLIVSLGLVLSFCCLIFVVAIPLLGLQLQLKALNYIAVFAVVNLLITCVSEEVFMRLLFQLQISRVLGRRISSSALRQSIAAVVTALLFTLTHAIGDGRVFAVYLLAGLAYGFIFALSGRLLMAIALHFLVNIIHFSFLTYPLA